MELWNDTKTISEFGFSTNDEEEIRFFKSVLDKMLVEAKRAGYKNMFTNDEKKFIKVLHEGLFGEEEKMQGQYLASGLTHHNYEE